ncbi:MAG: ribulose-phosphate 3-epimerase [Bacteroidales bacterium]|nr:ribulose-phosphate 3-epimerase [Bacteroidales bacterium]
MAQLVSPSILSADFLNLQKDIEMLNESQADWFHIDVMDGVFVPNITFGFPIIKQIRKIATKPLDVHLMIVNPERYLKSFMDAGADVLTVHIEACPHLHRTIQEIKDLGMKAGVAVNPHTSIVQLEEILDFADMILLMSVNPGFGGQKFITSTIEKIEKLKAMIVEKNAETIIQLDGGVDIHNAADIVAAGVDCLVAGSAVFSADNPLIAIEQLKKA